MTKKIIWPLSLVIVLGLLFFFFRFTDLGQTALWSWSSGGNNLLPLLIISALIDSINPCAFSILLLTIAFLFSLGQLRSRVLSIGGAYVFGLFMAYFLIGVGLFGVLHIFAVPHFMAKLGSFLLIILGLVQLINHWFPRFPLKLKIPTVAHSRLASLMHQASLPAAFLLGALVGLCEFPCTGGPYLTAIGLLHDHATYFSGLGYLLIYNLIFVLPLGAILLLAGNKQVVEKVDHWRREHVGRTHVVSGLAMIALGIIILIL